MNENRLLGVEKEELGKRDCKKLGAKFGRSCGIFEARRTIISGNGGRRIEPCATKAGSPSATDWLLVAEVRAGGSVVNWGVGGCTT